MEAHAHPVMRFRESRIALDCLAIARSSLAMAIPRRRDVPLRKPVLRHPGTQLRGTRHHLGRLVELISQVEYDRQGVPDVRRVLVRNAEPTESLLGLVQCSHPA